MRRTGGRTARTRDRVLDAVQALLADGVPDAVTIDAVAERSGVHRATIYRRWGSVAMLLVDLLARGVEDDWEPEDTGSLEGDLVALNRELWAALTAEPPLVLAVVTASLKEPGPATALRRFWADRYDRSCVIVRRAVERGELSSDVEAHGVLMAATGPLYHQRVLLGEEPRQADADAFARAAAALARQGNSRTSHETTAASSR